jgi:ssDNA-binding Zn-finger/Zn-ribbon topoisomerase 1
MTTTDKTLSTKWYNVIRRQLRAVQPTEHDVLCPDCGSRMWLTAGRWGRFYSCPHYECDGTVGARLDGTPRRERGSPEEIAARHRTRDVINQVVTMSYDPGVEEAARFIGNLRLKEDPFKVIMERAGVSPRPAAKYVRTRGFFLPERVDKPGLHLKKRTIEDCEKIRQAAIEYLRENRKNVWDRLACDGPSIETAG